MQRLLAEIRRGAVADGPVLLGLAALWALSLALLASNDINGVSFPSYQLNLTLYIAALFAASVISLAVVLLRRRPARPIQFLAQSVVSSGLASRFAQGAPMLAALVVFLPIFSKMKAAIPLFNSYKWDTTWIDLDRTIHGMDPWLILQPIIGYPIATATLALLYHLWLLLIYLGAVYFCFFQPDRLLRARFFIAYFACWAILGVAMATLFASVGPCFVEPLFGIHLFDGQMAYLRSANEIYPVMVLPVQDALLSSYLSEDTGLGRGISAMPSMHVSLAFLFFLATRRLSRLAGILFALFFVIILVGSVHLAYHYAVDGYFATLGTGLIWLIAGPLARRVVRTRSQ